MNKYINSIDNLLNRLFPIHRSITGDGNRESLNILSEVVPINIKEYPCNKEIFDWKIPPEWNVKEAYIAKLDGTKVVDINNSNLHLVSYSKKFIGNIAFNDLKNHLFYLEDIPDAIPYRTTYYKSDWGFCISFNQFQEIFQNPEDEYFVKIDSHHDHNGSLSLGELVIEGKSKKEFLISTYICHPSMANDNLTGPIVSAFLAKELMNIPNLKYTYRFLWAPETIGVIAYCYDRFEEMKAIDSGLVITTCGGPDTISMKESHNQSHYINQLTKRVLKKIDNNFISYPFDIRGSDERQYSSIGFNINTTSIYKSKFYEYDYYHTSLDNLDFVKSNYISESLSAYMNLILEFEKLDFFIVQEKYCENMLSKYNLYNAPGGSYVFKSKNKNFSDQDAVLWLLKYCDGNYPIQKLAHDLKVEDSFMLNIAESLCAKGLLKKL